jgi:hypothetical protein
VDQFVADGFVVSAIRLRAIVDGAEPSTSSARTGGHLPWRG